MDHENGSQPQPDVIPELLKRLQNLLLLQRKYQPRLTLPTEENENEVTLGIRDGSAHILRCLKVWYELPSEVLFISINIMDRFLTRMKVQPKHIACISVASFLIACKIVCPEDMVPESSHLITISQCKCTLRDLARMESVIMNKIGISSKESKNIPITSFTFINLFQELMCATNQIMYRKTVDEFRMFQLLEVIICDGSCANYEASHIALVLLCFMMNFGVVRLKPSPCAYINVLSLITSVTKLQEHCQISQESFESCFNSILKIISQYNSQSGMPHRQRLVWRLSHRTLRHLRPTKKLLSTLPTIEEQCH